MAHGYVQIRWSTRQRVELLSAQTPSPPSNKQQPVFSAITVEMLIQRPWQTVWPGSLDQPALRTQWRVREGIMNTNLKRLLIWTPRVLSILFALFLSLFALDVFGAGYTLTETLIALFMHLIPTFVLLLALAVAWRWEWVGAVIFLGFAVWYLWEAWGNFPFFVLLIIAGPPLLIGLLYLVDWRYRAELRPAH